MEYQHGGDIYTQRIDLDYSANINPLGLPKGVRKALASCLETDVCSVYPDSGCRRLQEALGRRHEAPASWIVCGNGAADLIFGLVHALKPKRGLVAAPTFSEYGQAMGVCGCAVDHVCLKEGEGFSFPTGRFLWQISKAGEEGRPYDLVFLCNPNNPTGISVPREDILDVADACLAYHTALIVDECFCDFLDEPRACSVVPFLEHFPNLFVLKAFTKLYAMAGLRLGYGLCSDEGLIGRLGEVRQPWPVSGPAQAAGEAALMEKAYVRQARELIGREREWMRRELSGLGFTVYGSEANYLFFKAFPCPGDVRPDAPGARDRGQSPKGWLYDRLLSRGVLIRSCGSYQGLDPSFYRVCVRTREENERFMGHMRAALDG